jgi:hypothetical protein
VSRDLDRLSKGQNVELHATFDKFGKTANLQVHDAPTDEENEEKKRNTGLKLFRVPNVRQVSHTEATNTVFSQGRIISECRNGRDETNRAVY